MTPPDVGRSVVQLLGRSGRAEGERLHLGHGVIVGPRTVLTVAHVAGAAVAYVGGGYEERRLSVLDWPDRLGRVVLVDVHDAIDEPIAELVLVRDLDPKVTAGRTDPWPSDRWARIGDGVDPVWLGDVRGVRPYSDDTVPGHSGAPLFDADGGLVGLHAGAGQTHAWIRGGLACATRGPGVTG